MARNPMIAGAVAGLVGGAALLLAEKVERELVLPAGSDTALTAEQAVDAVTEDDGKRLPKPVALGAGVAAQLAYCALFGALYGAVHERLHTPAWLDGLALAGLAYAAAVPERGLLPRLGVAPPETQSMEQAAIPIGSHLAFGVATAAVFEATA